jgi:hypothetical protein
MASPFDFFLHTSLSYFSALRCRLNEEMQFIFKPVLTATGLGKKVPLDKGAFRWVGKVNGVQATTPGKLVQ